MPIEIREHLDFVPLPNTTVSIAESHEDTLTGNIASNESIMVEIEGIHAITTQNYTRYMAEGLKGSQNSWTHPYNKPVILHHNEKDGKIIGRIHKVDYVNKNTRSGTPALRFLTNIADRDAVCQVKDGRLATVSVGISATDCRCSICGTNIAEEECEHKRGQIYNGETCFWDIYAFTGKELSYVISPSDPYAHNLRVIEPSNKDVAQPLLIQQSTEENELHIMENNQVIDPVVETEPTEGAVIEESSVNTTESTVSPFTEEPVVEADPQNADPQPTEPITESEEVDPIEPTETNVGLTENIAELQSQLNAANAALTIERNLRIDLEERLNDITARHRTLLVERVMNLRNKAGKRLIESDILSQRSIDSLTDTIQDLELEISNTNVTESNTNTVVIPTAINNTIITDPDNNDNNVTINDNTKSLSESINITKGFNDIPNILFK